MAQPLSDSLTTFLYVLMRDHLPTGTVKWLIENSQRAGQPRFSAPELEQLAERYADELRAAPPRELDSPTALEREEDDLPPSPSSAERSEEIPPENDRGASPPESEKPAKPNTGQGTGDGKASASTVAQFLGFLHYRGDCCKPSDFDTLGKSNATRARVLRSLRADRRVYVAYKGHQRYIVRVPDGCICEYKATSCRSADEIIESSDCPVHSPVVAEPKSTQDVSENQADIKPADIHKPIATPKNDPPTKAPSDDLVDRVDRHIDNAEGEVWPLELEQAFDLSAHRRRVIVDRLVSEGRIVRIGGNGPRVRYASMKARPGEGRLQRRPAGESPPPLGSSPAHLLSKEQLDARRKKEIDKEHAEINAAVAKLPQIREWVNGSPSFTPRHLREAFDISPAASTRVIAELVKEDLVTRRKDGAYEVPARRHVDTIGRRTRPTEHDSSLEGRALAALAGASMSLTELAQRLGVSEDTAKAVLGKLFREGEVRPRRKSGVLHYAATL